MAKHNIFDPDALSIIMNPAAWQVISTLWAPDVDFVHQPAHSRWMATHTERHPSREILVVLHGDTLYGFEEKVYPCRPGTVFLFNSYEPHDRYYPATRQDIHHLWINVFEQDVLATTVRLKEGKAQTGGLSLALNGNPLAILLAKTWDEVAANDPKRPDEFRRAKLLAALSMLFLEIIEQGFGTSKKQPETRFQHQVIETIRRHIAATAGRDVPLTEAARLSGYSKFHFLRLFKRESGKSFHDYVNQCRRRKVRAMLTEGRTKTEISAALGFAHPSTFLRWMKTQSSHG